MRTILLILLLHCATFTIAQVDFTNSKLPILVIETDGQMIEDEPKKNVHLGIIDNGPDQINNITDPFTNYDGIIGIELRGQSSQMFPKLPFGFETRDENGENNNVELLGMPKENDWVLHNPYSDKSLLRNVLAYKIAGELMEYAPRTRLCEVLLDGEYQGVYVLTEKIKIDDGRVNIAKLKPEDIEGDELTGGYIIKVDKPFEVFLLGWESQQSTFYYYHDPKIDELNVQQRTYIQNYVDDFENTLASFNFKDSIDGYRKYIDVSTFVDFFLVNEISRNIDGYRLSTYLFKDKESNGGRLRMGPVWDFNLAFGNADYCRGSEIGGWSYQFNEVCESDPWQVPFWWERLMLDPAFKMAIHARWTSLRSEFLSNQNMLLCIDNLVNEMGVAPDRNFQKWPILNEYIWPNSFVGNTYNNEISFLKEWLLDRMEWMDGAIADFENNLSTPNPITSATINPNPFSETIIVDYNAQANQKMKLQLFNVIGGLILESTQTASTDGNNQLIITPTLPNGIYCYRVLVNDEALATGKIMKK